MNISKIKPNSMQKKINYLKKAIIIFFLLYNYAKEDISKWEIQSRGELNKEELLKNKVEAFNIMCTKVKELKKKNKNY